MATYLADMSNVGFLRWNQSLPKLEYYVANHLYNDKNCIYKDIYILSYNLFYSGGIILTYNINNIYTFL